MDRKYYVYLHRHLDDGLIFYVGKGCDRRHKSKSNRTDWWKRVVAKHGYTSEIFIDGLTDDCSKLIEMHLISKFRREGLPLVNITDGGDGARGYIHTTESKNRIRDSIGGKPVYCSNGMVFDSQYEASDWLKSMGHEKAHNTNISACIRGVKDSYKGYSWAYDSVPDHPKLTKPETSRENGSKSSLKIRCIETGRVFKSSKETARHLRSTSHPKAANHAILDVCRGKYKTAYGYTWEFA